MKPKILAAVPLGTNGIESIGFCQVLKREAPKVIFVEAPMVAPRGISPEPSCADFCECRGRFRKIYGNNLT